MKEIKVSSTLIIKEGKFLLVKAKTGAAKGLWNNPGGRLDSDENFEEGALRETREETGYIVKLNRLINTYYFKEKQERPVIKKVFEAYILHGELSFSKREIEQAKWFSPNEVKDESEFTFGAVHSIKDYILKKFGEIYYPDRIA